MKGWRDWDGEMNRLPIDDTTAERLLSGAVPPEDAPPGYAGLAGIIQAATGPAVLAELAGEQAVVSAGVAAVRSALTIDPTMPRRTSMLTRMRSAQVAVAAAAMLLGAAGAAAAATGTLPAGVQSTVSDGLAHVNISVPSGSSTGQGGSSGGKPTDQGANAKADFGQCTAFLAGSHDGTGTTTTTSATSTTVATSTTTSVTSTTIATGTTVVPVTTLVPGTTVPAGKDSSTAFRDLIADNGGTVASTTAFCQTVVAAHQAAQGDSAATPADKGPSARADFGQCTAFLAGPHDDTAPAVTVTTVTSGTVASTIPSGKDSSTAFRDLIADHGGSVASTTAFCQTIIAAHQAAHGNDASKPADSGTPPGSTGKPVDPGNPAKPDDSGKPANPGSSGSHAPVSTPGPGTTVGGAGSAGSSNGNPDPHAHGGNGNPHKP